MRNLIEEGTSVVLNTDSFDTNGKVGTVQNVNTLGNRCTVLIEGVLHTLSLNEVEVRKFLSE